ncbi:adenylate cyclase [Dongia mobilis]|uniref:Adenylate cyclase n=1 Tax=Dongia mobilis TaxID=578943 RepID=A0A4R6WSX6_9PROT|nr:adenylate/guanylate cyclase domain-containing protein [Dongia mobilis]TDQ85432.1 adenylate cyclase [Dongia mobilis]
MAAKIQIANDDDLSDGLLPAARAGVQAAAAALPAAMPPVPMVARAMAGEAACLGCPAVEAAFQWMLEEGRLLPDLGEFVSGLALRLSKCGFPLLRFFVSVRTLHPQIAAIGYVWNKGDTLAKRVARDHAVMTSPEFITSPLRVLYQGEVNEIRRRLTPGAGAEAANDFPILDDMRKQGATDYAIFAIRLPGGVRSSVSIASDAPEGFAEAQLAAFRTLIPLLSLIIEAREWAYIARSLMHVYLGSNAGEAVLSGQIQRGDARTIAAAIWYCDLRGFTQMSNELPRDLVIATLNDYFDTVARPVIARGGEILKFIGDAMLAIFPMRDDLDRDRKCRIALDAAMAALAGLRDLNELRMATGQSALKIGIGLHAGSVSYGNIGAAQGEDARLDFTVIGPAVNLAERIETLCPILDQPLLASRQFASICGSTLKYLGSHPLRGFAEPQDVFGLP